MQEKYFRSADLEASKDQPNEMNLSPQVSVIVPTYNRPKMLEIALKSLVSQTFKNFEVLVINDSGLDPSNIVQQFTNHLNIRLLTHETNKGLAAARNTGVSASCGKYIAYLDDDDFYFENHLEVLYDFLHNSSYRIAYTDARQDIQIESNGIYSTVLSRFPYSINFSRTKFIENNITPVLCVMHERECLKRSGVFSEKLRAHEDWDLWLRLSRHYDFAHIPQVTCAFTTRSDSTSISTGQKEVMLETWYFTRAQGSLIQEMPPVAHLEQQASSPECIGQKDSPPCLCSIILPLSTITKNTVRELARLCIEAGEAQVVIVGSGIDRGQLVTLHSTLLKTLPNQPLVLHNEKDIGRLLAANQGAFIATGEWLIFLEEGVECTKGCFNAMLDIAATQTNLGAIGAVLHMHGNKPFAGGIIDNGGTPTFVPFPTDFANDFLPMPLVSSHCLMIRQELFASLGGFDLMFAPGHFADSDLCMRLAEKGFTNGIASKAKFMYNRHGVLLLPSATGMLSHRLFQEKWRTASSNTALTFSDALWSMRTHLWASDGVIPTEEQYTIPGNLRPSHTET